MGAFDTLLGFVLVAVGIKFFLTFHTRVVNEFVSLVAVDTRRGVVVELFAERIDGNAL